MVHVKDVLATRNASVWRTRPKGRLIAILLLFFVLTTGPAFSGIRPLTPYNDPHRFTHESPSIQPDDQAPATLEPGKNVTREITGGEAHFYSFEIDAGQYTQVLIDQRRINVAVTAFEGDTKIFYADLFAIGDQEVVSFATTARTVYRLQVKAPDPTALKGSYQILLQQPRTATDRERNLVSAERLIDEGVTGFVEGRPNARKEAIEKYEQSLAFCRAAKDLAWEATSLYLIGSLYTSGGDKQKGFDYADKSVQTARAAVKDVNVPDRVLALKVEANALDTLARVHLEFGDKTKSLELFNESLSIRKSINQQAGQIATLNGIGMAYGYLGEDRKSLETMQQVYLLSRELGDVVSESHSLNNMCVVNQNIGEYKAALDLCNKAVSARQNLTDKVGEAITLDNIGTIYASMGRYQDALEFHLKSMAIDKELSIDRGTGISLNNIGWIYGTLGDYRKAIDYYNQALEIFRKTGDRFREGIALSNVGANYERLDQYKLALDIQLQSLRIREELHDRHGRANSLNHVADCYSHLGDKQKALQSFEEALNATNEARLRALTLSNIGLLWTTLGDTKKALEYLNEGLQISRTIGDQRGEAGILYKLARLERDRGDLNTARGYIEKAIASVESLRINVKSYDLRSSFFASVRNYLDFYIDLLMRLDHERPTEGFSVAALEASEKSRARSLLELLNEASAEIRSDVDPELINRERTLLQLITDKAERQIRAATDKQDPGSKAAAKEIDDLTTEYELVQGQIRQKSPRYAALTRPVPLTAKEIQTNLLDPDTLLLEYSLGEDRSFVWAVSDTSIRAFELPKRETIESAALQFYQQLTARNQVVAGETPAKRQIRLQQADNSLSKLSSELSRMVLGPVATELKDKRLLIVGEGVLQYLPFAALPEPVIDQNDSGTAKTRQNKASRATTTAPSAPLIVGHEIVSLPSASVLSVLRRDQASRKTPDKTIAVLADPVFAGNDPRVKSSGRSQQSSTPSAADGEIKRSAAECGLDDFVRLRFSREEADRIVSLVSESKKFEAVDFAANRDFATGEEIGRYSILHFATHGLVNNQHPELSGVVLSLVDEAGRPQNGFLRLYDIYNTRLSADLVVLSACQTALGKDIKGEGLVGLTRGFMYAGARRIVASLWQVEDRATAELMSRFYQELLTNQQRPAAALRAAQISMWRDKRWSPPYYWSAFLLQGEWK